MTGIDTRLAVKSWGSGSNFLKGLGFISIEKDENGEYISLLTDEEANSDIALDKESALWLSKKLKEYSKEIK